MMKSGGQRKRRTFLSDGGRAKARSGLKSASVGREGRLSGRGSPTRPHIGNLCSDHGFRSEAVVDVEQGADPGAGGVPFHSRWIGNCVAACKRVAPWDGSWEAGWEGGCCWVGSWLGAYYAQGVSEAGMLKRGWMRGEARLQ